MERVFGGFMNLHKLFRILLAWFVITLPISALEVDEEELKSTGNDVIVFINYTGPHSKIDSLASIKKLGSDLGSVVANDPLKSVTAGSSDKYSVIHAVDSNQKDKLDADIIYIGSAASVDHIDNLRHIIASYLSSAYGYSEKDAETVAVFVTVYNAVYRKNFEAFKSKYKDIVIKNLSAQNCGLDINYKEWAGKSQIVIPLFDVKNGGLSTVDTSVISDSEVVKHMQEDDDKNVDSRKGMVDLKEREAEDAAQKAQEAKREAVKQEQKLSEEKQKTEEAKQEAEKAQEKAEKNPDDKTAQKEAEEKQQVYEEQKQVEQKQEEVTQQAQETAKEQQTVADKKNAEAQEERKAIAKDQQEVIKKELENASAPSAYGIELTDEASMLSGLIKVNTKTGNVIKASPVTYIRNRTMFQTDSNFIAIAGEKKGNGTVKLVLLTTDSMEICEESNEVVAEDSVLVQDNGEFYCIIEDGKNFKLAKYDSELNLKLKSDINVLSGTPITVGSEYVIVTGTSGRVCVLGKSDLKQVSSGTADAK